MFVTGESLRTFFAIHSDRREFVRKAITGQRRGGASLRSQGEFVLLVARDFVLFHEDFRSSAHEKPCHGAEEAVAVHAIHNFLIAETISPARTIQIKGQARHGLSAAGEDAIEVAGSDLGKAERNRLKP